MSSDERSSTVVSGDDDRIEIDDLMPEETYRFRMRAVNDRGPSPWAGNIYDISYMNIIIDSYSHLAHASSM